MLAYNKMEQPPRGSAETAALPAVRPACQQREKHPQVLDSGTYKNITVKLKCSKCSKYK